ncbi:MAG: acyltransferase [Erysipelotrichaceae bacterium]
MQVSELLVAQSGQHEKKRDSNFELFRIFLMLMIIGHHYVVNSGLTGLYDFHNITFNMVFLQLFGWGGKTGINCFLLITGYFMCKQSFNKIKLVKLLLEILFYDLLIYMIFVLVGYESFSIKCFLLTLFNIMREMNVGFTGGFIALYLMIPFLNILISNLDQRKHKKMVLLLILIYTISSSFFFSNSWGYLGWYITIYLIGSYIRLYPKVKCYKKYTYIFTSFILLVISWSSIIAIDYIGPKIGYTNYYFFVADSNKILALLCSISFFMMFKNINVRYNQIINTLGKSTFGVYLIHTSSDIMRQFLWSDIFNNKNFYNSPYLILHAISCVICVYIICVSIDLLRINFVAKPLYKYINSKYKKRLK